MPAPPTVPTLEYAPPPRRRSPWGLVLRRGVLPLGLVIVLAVGGRAAAKGWRWAQYCARVAAVEGRCMAYQPPVGLVVFEDDPQRAAALVRAGPGAGAGAGGRCIYTPGLRGARTYAVRQAGPHLALESELSVSCRSAEGTVFLGPLRDGNGATVLVAVGATQLGKDRVGFVVRAFQPGSSMRPLRQSNHMDWWCDTSAAGAVRVFAGRVDPADPTRFTFDFEAGDRRGTFEGAFRPDPLFAATSSLQLAVVSGPARPAPPDVQRTGTRFVLDPPAAAPAPE